EHCDFVRQPHVAGEEGGIRPDMVVHLPEKRSIVVDAKTPLDGYLNAVEATQDNERKKALAAHARNVRSRVRELSDRNYWAQFERSPEFVVLFIPGEQFLAAALDVDPKLQEDALAARIVL
ncbi:MAG: DNA recombination protein RmuC, partial [Hydrogenophaga sp.]|uniref:DNA recombination protein RmuC n=1 Tax=Hydrogenophaga sp. TaxID=1904254 RepID=UPI00168F8E33